MISEEKKLLSESVQQSMQGGLCIEQGAEEGKWEQHLSQGSTVIDDIANLMRENSKQRRRTEADDGCEKEGGGNGFADTPILIDGARLGDFRNEGYGCCHQTGRGQKKERHCHACQLAIGREGLDGILPMQL